MHHVVTPGFMDRTRWSDGTAGKMDGEAGTGARAGRSDSSPLERVKGVVDNNNSTGIH